MQPSSPYPTLGAGSIEDRSYWVGPTLYVVAGVRWWSEHRRTWEVRRYDPGGWSTVDRAESRGAARRHAAFFAREEREGRLRPLPSGQMAVCRLCLVAAEAQPDVYRETYTEKGAPFVYELPDEHERHPLCPPHLGEVVTWYADRESGRLPRRLLRQLRGTLAEWFSRT